VEAHLDHHAGAGVDDAVFNCNIQEFHTAWEGARRSIGRENLRFQDLRSAGLTFAALAGATIAEIRHRAVTRLQRRPGATTGPQPSEPGPGYRPGRTRALRRIFGLIRQVTAPPWPGF
jgi:hypothetical protein